MYLGFFCINTRFSGSFVGVTCVSEKIHCSPGMNSRHSTLLSLQNFIVRQSSQQNTRALSVRLPPDKGPYIQHYLIEIHNDGTAYSLEASENRFGTLPALIAYYSQRW